MPLDLTIVRGHGSWPRGASAALREGVEALEDHLIGLGCDDLPLRIEVRPLPAGLAGVSAELGLPVQPIVREGEDLDLPALVLRVLEGLRKEATRERICDGGGRPRPPNPEPSESWEALREDLYAIAHRELTHAVDLGDLPPGWVDASDLTDEALLETLDRAAERPASLRPLARRVRALLVGRIRAFRDHEGDFSLDQRLPDPDPAASAVQDEVYDFRVVDELPLRGADVFGEFEPPEERISDDEPTEPGDSGPSRSA